MIEIKEEGDALGLCFEIASAIGSVHGLDAVRFEQHGRHGQRVVEIGERGVWELGAGIQNGLRSGFNCLMLLVAGIFRPREVVINDDSFSGNRSLAIA